MKHIEQLTTAARLGAEFFLAGGRRIPCKDAAMMAMLAGRRMGETPEGEASSVALLKAWTASWDEANLSAKVVS